MQLVAYFRSISYTLIEKARTFLSSVSIFVQNYNSSDFRIVHWIEAKCQRHFTKKEFDESWVFFSSSTFPFLYRDTSIKFYSFFALDISFQSYKN